MLDRGKVVDEIKNYMRENTEMGWVNEDKVLQKIKELLPEGAVVLTKEEYMQLASYISEERAREIFHEETEKLKEVIRKETVKEILRKAEKKARFVDGGLYCKDRYELNLDDLKMIIKKDFGVEVEE